MLMKTPNVAEVIEAKNGADAIAVLKERDDIDIILLDIIMPVMGGIEMLKIVRADESLKQLPIIVLTTDETKKIRSPGVRCKRIFNETHSRTRRHRQNNAAGDITTFLRPPSLAMVPIHSGIDTVTNNSHPSIKR